MQAKEPYQEWKEGRQEIRFPKTWQVIKVDDHPFYRQVSGQGLKSVDFLALDPDWGLYFIELKDYRHRLSPEEKVDLTSVFRKLPKCVGNTPDRKPSVQNSGIDRLRSVNTFSFARSIKRI